MHAFDIEYKQILASIEEKIKHTYLEQYIKKPSIDKGKLYILLNIMNQTSLPNFKKRQYIITTMLVQIALDIHDSVPISNEDISSKDDKVSMQLSVLAGDYYSGLYYLLLSEIEDLEMVHLLASAIKEINEYKMIIYYKETMSFEKYIYYVEKINALLIIRVTEHFNITPILSKIVSRLLITNRLIEEKSNIYDKSIAPALNDWLLHTNKDTPVSIQDQVEIIILNNTKAIETSISQSADQIKLFNGLINYLLTEISNKKTSIVEEG